MRDNQNESIDHSVLGVFSGITSVGTGFGAWSRDYGDPSRSPDTLSLKASRVEAAVERLFSLGSPNPVSTDSRLSDPAEIEAGTTNLAPDGVIDPSSPRNVVRGDNSHVSQDDCQISIGWIQGVVSRDIFEPLLQIVQARFGEGERKPYGIMLRDSMMVFRDGVKVAFNDGKNEETGDSCVLIVPQTALEGMSHAQQIKLYHSLREMKFKATRVDISFDDMFKCVMPFTVLTAALNGAVPRCRKAGIVGDFKIGPEGSSVDGQTIYIGSRGDNGGGRYLRVYRKDLESDGAIDAVRWEAEFSEAKADAVFKLISACEYPESLTKTAGKILGGCVDFVQRHNREKNLSRLERYPWWDHILLYLSRCKLALPVKTSTLEQSMVSVDEQYAAWMANIDQFLMDRDPNPLSGETFDLVGIHGEVITVALEFTQYIAGLVQRGRGILKPRHEDKRASAIIRYRHSIEGVPDAA